MPAIVVIGNPTARRYAHAVDAVLQQAARTGVDARVVPTTVAEPGGAQALAALHEGADAVVAVGGDGTVREIAAVLAHTGTPLGIMPVGTANLFARNLRLPLRHASAAAQIALGQTERAVDLGRVTLTRGAGEVEAERVFLVVTGVGNDALAVEASSLHHKRRLGWASYIAAGTRLLRSPSFAVRGKFDAGAYEQTRAWSVLVHNAARIPAGLQVLPDTRLDDGMLHVAVVSPRHLAHWGRIAAAGARIGRAESVLSHRTAQRVRLTEVDALLPVQIDGDPAGRASTVDTRVDPAALRVRVQ